MNNASQLIGKTIDSVDGEIGSVHDLYFDNQTWSVRYLVVDTGKSCGVSVPFRQDGPVRLERPARTYAD